MDPDCKRRKISLFISPYGLETVRQTPPHREGLQGGGGERLCGALLLVEFAPGFAGYSDFLPWPRFGERSLREQLKGMKNGRFSARGFCALKTAFLDAKARAAKRSLFFGLKIPDSHFLITSPPVSWKGWEYPIRAGYKTIKLKFRGFADFLTALPQLQQTAEAHPDLQWRLDFNGSLKSLKEWRALRRRLNFLQDRTEFFIEDPFPPGATAADRLSQKDRACIADDWTGAPWTGAKRLETRGCNPQAPSFFLKNLPAAARRAPGKRAATGTAFSKTEATSAATHCAKAGFRVIKPLRDDFTDSSLTLFYQGIVFTHGMETLLGQAAAAFWAGRFYRRRPAYFRTGAFKCLSLKKSAWTFHEDEGPVFNVPSGFGLGFRSLLEKEPWRKLSRALI